MKVTKEELKFLINEIEELTELYGKTAVYLPKYNQLEVYPTMKGRN